MARELYRHDLTLLHGLSGSDDRQIPADNFTVKFYREGAYASSASGSPISGGGSGTIDVYDPGAVSVGDTVQIGATAADGVGTITAITGTQLTVTATTTMTWIKGSRIVPTSGQPKTYVDDRGSEETTAASEIATGSAGSAFAYTRERVVDLIVSGTGVSASVIPDQTGVGQGLTVSPMDWGARVDGSTNDYQALANCIAYVVARGGGVIEIPPGTMRLGSTVIIPAGQKIRFRGSGRGLSIFEINHTNVGFSVAGSNVEFSGLTLKRLTGTAHTLLILTADDTRVQDVEFTGGGIGLGLFQDINTTVSNVIFSGSGWTSFITTYDSTRPHFVDIIARYSGNITRGIDIDTDTKSPRFDRVNISPATVTASGGPALVVRQATAGTNPPRDVIVTSSTLCGGSSTGTAPGVQVIAGQVVEFIGVNVVDSNIGFDIDGGTGVRIIGGSHVGINLDGIDINGGSYVHVVEHLSSNVNLSGSSKDHINIAAGLNDIYVNGLTVGRMIRGTSTPQARYGVAIEAGASARVQILGIRGAIADLSSGWYLNGSTSAHVDISHNIEFGNNRSYAHSATSAAEGTGGAIGTKTITSGTTIDVTNVSTLILQYSGATTLANLTGGATGQVLYVVAVNTNATVTDAGNINLLGAGAFAMTTAGSTLTLVYESTILGKWLEVSRSAN